MKIVLTRKISVDAVTALLDIGNYRDEYRFFLPVLALSADGTISSEDVNTQLFFTGRDDPRGRLLLERLEKYRLIEPASTPKENERENRSFRLTESGQTALNEGKVPIPESGVFLLHGTDDPLFAEPLLACTLKTGADHHHNGKDRTETRKTGTGNPSWFSRLQERVIAEPQVIQLAAENNRPVQVLTIREPGETTPSPYSVSIQLSVDNEHDASLIVFSNTGANKHGSGAGGGAGTAVRHLFASSFSEVIRSLLRDYQDDIVEDDGGIALRTSFDEIKNDPSILGNRRKDLRISAPKIEGFGRFDDVKIADIRLIPRTLDDASGWATWMIRERVRYYVDSEQFESIRKEIAGLWEPHFRTKQILARLPSFDSFTRECKERRGDDPECFWFVITPTVLTVKEV